MELPKRKKLRLPDYDYSENGAYFITICTKNKAKILCSIQAPANEAEAPEIHLTPLGKTVETAIQKIPGMETYVVMPNHVHMIILNQDHTDISAKVRLFKSVVARKTGMKIWQTSFYDHVIRDESDFQIKWKYIDDNPAKWASDEYYGI